MSASASTSSASTVPAKRHGLTPTELQKVQLDRLSKDPSKPAFIPTPPQEKTVRAAREMMKNVQGSSAGAGSGEFHVYKAGRRREYERLKIFQEQSEKEKRDAEYLKQRNDTETQADAKTAKNRAKRQKKKEHRGKGKGAPTNERSTGDGNTEAAFKKRRLVDGGKELVFRRPGEDAEDEDIDEGPSHPESHPESQNLTTTASLPVPVEAQRITIHEDE